MGRLYCKNCNGYYILKSNEHASDFECCSVCGGSLEYFKEEIEDVDTNKVSTNFDKVVNENLVKKKNNFTVYKRIQNEIIASEYNVNEVSTTKKSYDSNNTVWDVTTDTDGLIKRQKSLITDEVNSTNYTKNSNINDYVRKTFSNGETYTEKMVSQYQNNKVSSKSRVSNNKRNSKLFNSGLLLLVLGLILCFFNSIFLILIPIGLILLGFSIPKHRKTNKKDNPGSSWVKGLEGENIVLNYLNTLPRDYYVFHDVTLPDKQGNIDDVIIGPNGLFIIETKNYNGKYRINGDQWYYYNNKTHKHELAKYNPVLQLMRNTIDLKNFLETQGIFTSKISFNPIIAFIKFNFEISRKSSDYEILLPEELTNFILTVDNQNNPDELNKAVEELKLHSTRYTY